jgi:hypothetical protein
MKTRPSEAWMRSVLPMSWESQKVACSGSMAAAGKDEDEGRGRG